MRGIVLSVRLANSADCGAGLRTGLVAKKHGVSEKLIRNLKQERLRTVAVRKPRRRGPGQNPKIDRAQSKALVEADADAALAELRERLGGSCFCVAHCRSLF